MITFNGNLITAGEGTYRFAPGIMNRVWQFKRLARADGEISHNKGRAGCDHVLTVRFSDVPVAGISGIQARIESLLADPSEYTLTVPDYGSYPNCVVSDIQESEQTRTIADLQISGGLDFTKTYMMEYTVTFRQLRA